MVNPTPGVQIKRILIAQLNNAKYLGGHQKAVEI